MIIYLLIQWGTIWQPICIKLSRKSWTCTGDRKNDTKTFSKLWIYPVIIMLNNSITSSHLVPPSCNWVTRKLPIIPIHIEMFMLHILFLNMIMKHGKLCIILKFLFLVFIACRKNKTHQDCFSKLAF